MHFWKWFIIGAFWMINEKSVYAQKVIVKVTEERTGEPLSSVNLSDSITNTHTLTNRYGHGSMILDRTPNWIRASLVGYESTKIKIYGDTVLKIVLKPYTLQEVEVKAKYQNTENINQLSITPTLLNNLPSLGGEKDLLKAIGVFAGVSMGSELSSGINVRGGTNDQNLFYLDGAPIYSIGHLFNFLSLFNADALQKVNFYKGDFPVEFGGRLSSVTDVMFREGNKDSWEGKAELGVVSSKFLIEGPIKKDKTSLLIAGRTAYFNLFNIGKKKAIEKGDPNGYLGYNFYDLNLKFNHTFHPNHKLFISYYRGNDKYESLQNDPFGTTRDHNRRNLTNQLFSLRTFHVLSSRWFLQTGAHFTRYHFDYDEGQTSYSVVSTRPKPWLEPELTFNKIGEENKRSTGKISDISANVLVEGAITPTIKAKIGGDIIKHTYTPIDYLQNNSQGDSLSLKENDAKALEGGIFAGLLFNLSPHFQLNIGSRFSYFITNQANYQGFEPRVSFSFRKSPNHQFSWGITQMRQYNHALLKSGELVDKITWVPSTPSILPQRAWQYTAGWSHANKLFKHSLGLFYKSMKDLSQYQYYYGDPYLYYNWQNNTLSKGQGKAYGIEMTLEKNYRRWDWSLNYTLSWNKRQFSELNQGAWFNDLYDRRHVLNTTALFKINKTTQLSLLWVYYSGQRYNRPAGRIVSSPMVPDHVVYDNLNNGKYPDYHRLDVSLTKKYLLSRGRFWELNFNLYNAYSRRNTYRLYPAIETIRDAQNRPIETRNVVKSTSVFPILPSISIIYKFR